MMSEFLFTYPRRLSSLVEAHGGFCWLALQGTLVLWRSGMANGTSKDYLKKIFSGILEMAAQLLTEGNCFLRIK